MTATTSLDRAERRYLASHPAVDPADLDRLMTRRETADRYNLGMRFLELAAHKGFGGPPYIKLGSKTVRYRVRDVEAWLTSRMVAGDDAAA